MGDIVKSVIEFLNSFLAAPLGQSIIVVAVVTIAGFYLRGWSKDRLASQRVKSDEAKTKLDGEIRMLELENERKEDDRHALSDAENRAMLGKLVETQSSIVTILQRMESRQQSIGDTTQEVKDNTDAIAQRAGVINKNILAVGNKVDAVQADSRARTATLTSQMNQNDQQTWGMINTRTQKVEASVDDLGHRLDTKQNERHTQQMELMDQVLKELISVGNKIVDIQKQPAITHKVIEDSQAAEILGKLREIVEIVRPKKRPTGDLDPSKLDRVATPTISPVVDIVPLVSEAVGLPKKNTEPMPPPQSTITPAAPVDLSRPITGTFATPTTTGNEETQKLVIPSAQEPPHA